MVDGWNNVHGGEPQPEPMDDDTFDAMVDASAEAEAARMTAHGR